MCIIHPPGDLVECELFAVSDIKALRHITSEAFVEIFEVPFAKVIGDHSGRF